MEKKQDNKTAVSVIQSNELSLSNKNALSNVKLLDLIPPVYPLTEPIVDRRISRRHWLERSTEVFAYSIKSLEYALSPSGRLRQFIKLNLLLLCIIGIPLLIFLPLTAFAFNQLTDITYNLQLCMNHLLQAAVPVMILVFVLSLIVMMVKR